MTETPQPAGAPATAPKVITELDGHVLIVTLNRPEARNAIDLEVSKLIADAMMRADAEPQIRAVLVTGPGPAPGTTTPKGRPIFCAGADLRAMGAGEETIPSEKPYDEWGFGGFTTKTPRVPVVVAATGSAYGGGTEVLLAGDVVIAERGSQFALPEVRHGLFAGGGGVYRTPAILGRAAALDLLLTAEPISAERAYELGMISRLVEVGTARQAGLEVARTIARASPLAVAETKRLARSLVDGVSTAERAIAAEADRAFRAIQQTEDFREGMRAFAEKREPSWPTP